MRFLVRNHSLTALCFGKVVDKLDMVRRVCVKLFSSSLDSLTS